MSDKQADLAGPGIGNYDDLKKILPPDYKSLLTPRETMQALFAAKHYIEENLCKELNLMMVQVPLIVDKLSGVNDMLDRDGSRTPVEFHISNDHEKNPVDGQVVQAATKWKRVALKQFDCKPGEGICTDMKAVRKDYFLDHDHSAYVDQWDWEMTITEKERNLDFLTGVVQKIWKVITGAEAHVQSMFPSSRTTAIPTPPKNWYSCTPRRYWRSIQTSRASSVRRSSSRSSARCSSMASAGRLPTDTRTKCARRITTTG